MNGTQKYDSLFASPSPQEDDFMALLQRYEAEGRLDELFQPFGQEQNVLDQEMALAEQLRRPGPQRSSPWGAALGGLSNALGNVGGAVLQKRNLDAQQALGGRMQGDAAGRMQALLGMRGDEAEEERQEALENFLRQRGQGLGFSGPMMGGE